jgi:hypothetical protein
MGSHSLVIVETSRAIRKRDNSFILRKKSQTTWNTTHLDWEKGTCPYRNQDKLFRGDNSLQKSVTLLRRQVYIVLPDLPM